MAAIRTFLQPDPQTGGVVFERGRLARYERHWALFNNTAYDDISSYVRAYPLKHKLYKKTRGLRNPLISYANFWQANIWGGSLDANAGDGSNIPSAIPIITNNDDLRPAIAQVWKWSNWGQKKQVATLYGAVLGDTFIEVVDNPVARKVYLKVRWPGDVKRVEWDDFGNIKMIEFEYQYEDNGISYTYGEKIEHPSYHNEGNYTIFRTYKNNEPWAYDGYASVWEVPYDFVPIVHIPFVDAGVGWGMVRFESISRLIDEASAKASIINDQLSKELNPPLVTYGILARNLTFSTTDDDVPMIEVSSPPSEAKIDQLIYDMNIDSALASLQDDLVYIREMLPELQLVFDLRSGLSSQTLEVAYAPLIAQVEAVRANYNSGIVRAHNMAMAIGGIRGYSDAFSGIGLDSYSRGLLDHSVGDRPVLPYGNAQEVNERKMRWDMAAVAASVGLPMPTIAREILGWDNERIANLESDLYGTFMGANE